eukprot:TRINITY_DN23197_c0_g1_i2.p1 TRINITY_DN23197_c0_g1~~TRINITY_DN23197_c0_g1_i2.p1  ORF type:complete len:323 (+),score=75.13 TRINITY_DN23197_c0_g1_i2:126-1094(+)
MGNASAGPFSCCLVHPKAPEAEFLKSAAYKVELAVSPLGGLPGLMAYHTSVVLNGEEFFFCQLGIMRNRGLESHRRPGEDATSGFAQAFGGAAVGKGGPQVIELGSTVRSGDLLYQVLCDHFRCGSYDLLHKNCNTFTDVALYFLLGRRLDPTYCSLEKVGVNNPRLLEQLTRGAYVPNELALEFNLDEVLRLLDDGSGEDPLSGERRLPAGTVAKITGLKSKAAEALNGKACVIHRYVSSTGRYEVDVCQEVKALRVDNLVPYFIHQEMMIEGLQSQAAMHLNGEVCRLLKYNSATERLEVKINSTDEVKALKVENLQPVL